LGRNIQTLAGIAAARAEVRQGWARISLTQRGPAPSSPAWAAILGPPAWAGARVSHLGRRPRSPGWAVARSPGWAAARFPRLDRSSVPRLGQLRFYARAFSRPGGAGMVPQLGQGLQHPARPVSLLRAGASQAGIPRQAGIYLFRLGLFWCTVPAGPGRDSLAQAGLLLSQAEIHLLRYIYSSDINFSASCQSWDASRLGLARPPSSYASLGTPLGSDQHIPPLLVSLILRRRIRLVTW
jgi:hypothetical protein